MILSKMMLVEGMVASRSNIVIKENKVGRAGSQDIWFCALLPESHLGCVSGVCSSKL